MLSMRGSAVLLARVPAHGLEGAQAGVHGGTAMSDGESQAAMSLEEAQSRQVKVYHSAVARGHEELARFKLGRLCTAVRRWNPASAPQWLSGGLPQFSFPSRGENLAGRRRHGRACQLASGRDLRD